MSLNCTHFDKTLVIFVIKYCDGSFSGISFDFTGPMCLLYIYSGRGKFMPLSPKSKVPETNIGIMSHKNTFKGSQDKFVQFLCRPFSW
jgi:hypothetical protein